jgi:hypothetical protein
MSCTKGANHRPSKDAWNTKHGVIAWTSLTHHTGTNMYSTVVVLL